LQQTPIEKQDSFHQNIATIGEGLDYISTHFQSQEFWPRTISTKTTESRQITVSSQEEALARFAQANWLDCRISAYPPNATENKSAIERFQGLTNITPRRLIIIVDLDRCNFETDRALQVALTRTLQTINEELFEAPTVIWSGNGYHIYLVMDSEGIVLENIKQLTEFGTDQMLSIKFIRFVEWFLSNGKSDKSHNTTVSFNNCMLRIPGSYNSKNNAQVLIIRKWQNTSAVPSIKPLLRDFRRYLIDQQLKELQSKSRHIERFDIGYSTTNTNENSHNINWIEQLLQTPVADHRKYCIWRILAPYLLNIRKLPEQEAFNVIREWLNRCSELQRLQFSINQRINDGLDGAAKKGYLPISLEKLKQENDRLYGFLHISGVVDRK
jgi:hypothetical protein